VVFVEGLAVVQQAADQGRFPIVDAAGGGEPQEVGPAGLFEQVGTAHQK